MSPRSSRVVRAALYTVTSMVLLSAVAGCGDDSKSDPGPGSDEATQSSPATDKPADPATGKADDDGKGDDDGKASAAPGQPGAALDRPGTLARPPGDGTLPADLRPPR